MVDTNTRRKSKEKRNSKNKNPPQNKPKVSFTENKLITNKTSKFTNKLEHPKYKEFNELNQPTKDDNFKNFLPFNSDKRILQNSVFQDLIGKILEINNTETSHKNNSSKVLLCQKEGSYSNSINSIKKIRKSVQSLPQIKNKNNKHDILKSKNNINAIYKSASQDFRKHSNIKTDSSNSFIAHQSEDEYKYNSSITDNFKIHLKKPDIFFGFNQVSGSSSSQQITFRVPSKKI